MNRGPWWYPSSSSWAWPAILVLKQPDMGTALVLACIALSMLYAGGVPLRPVLKVLAGVAILGVALGLAEPYRRARLLSFLNPFAHAQGSGYQVVQSLVGLGSGRLFGLGLAGGREKWGLLPNAHTDFIFSVIGEEAGLFGALIVLGSLRRSGVVRAAGRRPGPRPLRGAVGRRRHLLDHEPGRHQHRRRHRAAARHRHPAALHLLRWVVAGHHHDGGGDPGQRGQPRETAPVGTPGGAPRPLGGARPPRPR